MFSRVDVNTLQIDSLYYVSNVNLYLDDCTVSPDEKEILFSAYYGSPPIKNIWKINLQTKEMIQITFNGGSYPAYDPTGHQIVYTNTNIKEGGLWIMNSDGSNKRILAKLKR